jgi:hypothetical protein
MGLAASSNCRIDGIIDFAAFDEIHTALCPSLSFILNHFKMALCVHSKECKCIAKQERSCLQRQKPIGIEADRMSLSYA